MKKFLSKQEWILWFLSIAPSLVMYLAWQRIPETIPTHYNFSGEVDDWGNKSMLLWLVPGLSLFIYLLLLFLPLIDPKMRMSEMGHKYFSLRLLIQGVISYILIILQYTAYSKETGFVNLLFPALAIFLMILGNYLQAIRPNYFIGIRTPWALQDEKNWQLTHRFGGRLYFAGGLLLFLLSLLINASELKGIFLGLLLIIIIIPVFYSFYLFTIFKHSK